MSASNPFTYLSRHNVFYFRVVILIRQGDGEVRQEYRKSLKTRDPSVARKMSRVLMTCVDKVCDGGVVDLVTWKTLKKMLDDHFVQLTASARKKIADQGPSSIMLEHMLGDKCIPAWREYADEVSIKRFEHLRGEEVHLTGRQHLDPDRLLKVFGIDDLKDNPELYMQFCEVALRMIAAYYERVVDLNKDAREFNPDSFAPGQQALAPPTGELPSDDDLLSEVAEKYRNELKAGGNWTDKTYDEYKSAHDLLIEVINDRCITAVDNKAAQFFKSTVLQLPSKRTTKPQYKGKSVDQLRKMKIPAEHKLSISSVNKYIGMASYLMTWAVKNGFASSNPFAGIKIKENIQAQDKREPFSNEDLVALFSSPIFTECKCKHSYC